MANFTMPVFLYGNRKWIFDLPPDRQEEEAWRFTPHEKSFTSDASRLASERLVKFNLPSTERVKVLKFLDAFNLNAYSLFGSEESLMETIAVREFYLK